jgi:GTPase
MNEPPQSPNNGNERSGAGEEHRSGFVALIGRPNSGKSTLLNTVIGETLSVVTPLPQTTRRNVRGIYTDDKVQLVFVDTPGMHKGGHRFNKSMLETASSVLTGKQVDVIAYLVDLYRDLGDEEDLIAALVSKIRSTVVIVFNKADVCDDATQRVRVFYERYPQLRDRPHIQISATSPKSKALFLKAVLPYIPQGPRLFPADDLTDQHLRFFAVEYLLKGIILNTREEVPHACFVEVTDYKELPDRHVVEATIHVESDGQKGILIGQGGTKIGRIRAIAENELSRLAGVPVSYHCHIKVSPKWRDDQRFLEGMGYGKQG